MYTSFVYIYIYIYASSLQNRDEGSPTNLHPPPKATNYRAQRFQNTKRAFKSFEISANPVVHYLIVYDSVYIPFDPSVVISRLLTVSTRESYDDSMRSVNPIWIDFASPDLS